MRGVVFALPGFGHVLGAPLLAGPQDGLGLPAGTVPLLAGALCGYGRRPRAEVVRDLSRYRDWYGVDGAFLDQVTSGLGDFGYYQRLATAAWGAGCTTLALNHGAPPHPAYARLADVLVTFEGTWETYRTLRPAPFTGGRTRQCHLVHGVPPGEGAHPWGALPHALQAG
ncbi:spherulation-specific family 4 protein [Streptomyces sp. NPDC020766]|uniref:spherulation-specific family 4 protein n=1 Tax=Streptomyces sp. NPDC020766 TaxID=3155011 RepID=UPI0033F24CE7